MDVELVEVVHVGVIAVAAEVIIVQTIQKALVV
jgi:hypothetical protein